MKQSESDKILNKILKEESKILGWKFARGFVFKKEKDTFFTILITGVPKIKRLSWSLTFKHYDFDEIFWDIVKLPENKSQPLSFRACGAWVAPSIEAVNGYEVLEEWEEQAISKIVKKAFEDLNRLSLEIASSNVSYESNLEMVENYYTQIMKKHPNAVLTIWKEKLLTCLLLGNKEKASEIATSRINAGDMGGFNFAGSSFFQLAKEYIDNVKHT